MALLARLNNNENMGNEWMTKIPGISRLKEYLNQVSMEKNSMEKNSMEKSSMDKAIETVAVEHITPSDLSKLDDLVMRLLSDNQSMFFPINECMLVGSPLMLALAIKDYKIAERILDKIEDLTVRKCGRLSNSYNYMNPFNGISDYNIMDLLYSNSFFSEKKLRPKLLNRLSEEALDLYDFKLPQTLLLDIPAKRVQLREDINNYPKLYKRKEVCYASDMESMFIMMKFFNDDECINQLLADNCIGLYSKDHPNDPNFYIEGVIDKDIYRLESIVRMLTECDGTHKELICFMLKMVTELRRRKAMTRDNDEYFVDAENKVWNCLLQVWLCEDDLYQIATDADKKGFRSELVYEYANRNNQKMTYYVPEDMNYLEQVFRLNNDDDNSLSAGLGFIQDDAQIGSRLFHLVNDIGSFRYSNKSLKDTDKLGTDIGSFLTSNPNIIKDVYMELLLKGFVPESCLEAVIKKVSKCKKSAYMLPLLITYKFGGLDDDEG